MGADPRQPGVHHLQRPARLVEGHERAGVGEPDRLVAGIAAGVDNAPPGDERLHRVVDVEVVVEVGAPLDDGDRRASGEHLAGVVRGLDRGRARLRARSRPRDVGGRGADAGQVAGAPRVGIVRATRRGVRAALRTHVRGRPPAADAGVEVEEPRRAEPAVAHRAQPVLHPDVVPRPALTWAQALPIAPPHRVHHAGRVHERPLRLPRRVARIEQPLGEAAPAVRADAGAARCPGRDPSRQALDQGAVRPGPPQWVAAGVEVVLQRFTVADSGDAGDGVGEGELRNRRVDQAGVVFGADVLLHPAAGAADADGMARHPVRLDEVLLHHERGLGGQPQIEVYAGLGAGRSGDRVAAGQAGLVERVGVDQHPLVVADADAAAEPVEEPAVPAAHVSRIAAAERGQHGDGVDEPVDDTAFPPDEIGHGVAVQRGGLDHVGRAAARVGQRMERAVGGPVEVVHLGTRGAVPAPAGDLQGAGAVPFGEDPQALAGVVVDDRLAEAGPVGPADERILTRPGKDRPVAVVVQRERGAPPGGRRGQRGAARPQPADDGRAFGAMRGPQQARQVGAVVAGQPHLVGAHAARDGHHHPGVAAGDLIGVARRDGQGQPRDLAGEPRAGRPVGVPVGGEQSGQRAAGHDRGSHP